MIEDDKSRVEKLNENLNSRTKYTGPNDRRAPLPEGEAPAVESEWNSLTIDEMLKRERRKAKQDSTLKKVFFVALLFFVCAIGVAAYIFYEGGNFISSKNVDISVLGPVSVNAGENFELGVTIANKNNADLESTSLYVQYPEGTRSPEDSTQPLTRDREVIGEIKAGREATHTIKAIMLGEKGDTKLIKITVEYKVKGSNATFSKEKDYTIGIGNTPVTLNIEMPRTVTSGDTFPLTLTILANSSEILKNIIVRGEYPYGFTVSKTTPEALQGNNVWVVGDLNPGDKKTIIVEGKLTGQDDEERTFRFYAGVGTNADTHTFTTPLAMVSETLPIKRPGIGLDVQINSGNSDSPVAPAGKIINSTIKYKNNLPTNLLNVRIEAKLSGAVLDKSSVVPQGGGFYDSTTNTVVWDRNNFSQLEALAPGDSGVLSLNFASISQGLNSVKNQSINLDVKIYGAPQDSNQTISVADSESIKIASEITLTGKSLYSRGPFKNTGPVPPKAEKETTYTLVLDTRNTQNDIKNTKVTASLGSNVTWLNKISPTSENVTYDDLKKTVTWDLGTLVSGSGFDAVGREVSFQVSLKPSIGQIGSAPILLNNILLSGTDSFTNVEVTKSADAITTRTSSDPSFIQGNETVVK